MVTFFILWRYESKRLARECPCVVNEPTPERPSFPPSVVSRVIPERQKDAKCAAHDGQRQMRKRQDPEVRLCVEEADREIKNEQKAEALRDIGPYAPERQMVAN